MMFDPFKDFATAGYLRNRYKEKDHRIIKKIEHDIFIRNISRALEYLSSKDDITYFDFLGVHHLLFTEFYPWAGLERSVILPNCAVRKGDILFAHPLEARRAVEHGLRMGKVPDVMKQKPGEVMGLFAYGHPFLDGNGRTMLIIHTELSWRAGFSIEWDRTNKSDYLHALSNEINTPGKGVLDEYLLQFKGPRLAHHDWNEKILAMKGLHGVEEISTIGEDLIDPRVVEKYCAFRDKRQYSYEEYCVSAHATAGTPALGSV